MDCCLPFFPVLFGPSPPLLLHTFLMWLLYQHCFHFQISARLMHCTAVYTFLYRFALYFWRVFVLSHLCFASYIISNSLLSLVVSSIIFAPSALLLFFPNSVPRHLLYHSIVPSMIINLIQYIQPWLYIHMHYVQMV